MKSRNNLIICGIIMCIGGVISLYPLYLIIMRFLASLNNNSQESLSILIMFLIIGLFVSIFQFYVGLIGIISWKTIKNARYCIKLGLIYIFVKFIFDILLAIFTVKFNVLSRIIGYILPTFYIIGAMECKHYEFMYYEEMRNFMGFDDYDE